MKPDDQATPDATGEGPAAAATNLKKLAGAESDPAGTARKLHEQGMAQAAKRGVK